MTPRMSDDEERLITFAVMAVRTLLPGAKWRVARIDGVAVVYATVSEVAESARTELAQIADEDEGDSLRRRYWQTDAPDEDEGE